MKGEEAQTVKKKLEKLDAQRDNCIGIEPAKLKKVKKMFDLRRVISYNPGLNEGNRA